MARVCLHKRFRDKGGRASRTRKAPPLETVLTIVNFIFSIYDLCAMQWQKVSSQQHCLIMLCLPSFVASFQVGDQPTKRRRTGVTPGFHMLPAFHIALFHGGPNPPRGTVDAEAKASADAKEKVTAKIKFCREAVEGRDRFAKSSVFDDDLESALQWIKQTSPEEVSSTNFCLSHCVSCRCARQVNRQRIVTIERIEERARGMAGSGTCGDPGWHC